MSRNEKKQEPTTADLAALVQGVASPTLVAKHRGSKHSLGRNKQNRILPTLAKVMTDARLSEAERATFVAVRRAAEGGGSR